MRSAYPVGLGVARFQAVRLQAARHHPASQAVPCGCGTAATSPLPVRSASMQATGTWCCCALVLCYLNRCPPHTAAVQRQSSPAMSEPLTGKNLLAAVKQLSSENQSKSAQAKACGYLRVIQKGDQAGKEMPDIAGFSAALLEAQGFNFGGYTPRGPRGVLTVSKAGLIAVGKAYLPDAEPGDQYRVEIEDDGVVCLVPVAEEQASAAAETREAVAA